MEYLEPWGYAIDNHRAAIAAYTTVCCNAEHPPEYGKFLEDWFGDREKEPEPEKATEDKAIELVKANVAALGGIIA